MSETFKFPSYYRLRAFERKEEDHILEFQDLQQQKHTAAF